MNKSSSVRGSVPIGTNQHELRLAIPFDGTLLTTRTAWATSGLQRANLTNAAWTDYVLKTPLRIDKPGVDPDPANGISYVEVNGHSCYFVISAFLKKLVAATSEAVATDCTGTLWIWAMHEWNVLGGQPVDTKRWVYRPLARITGKAEGAASLLPTDNILLPSLGNRVTLWTVPEQYAFSAIKPIGAAVGTGNTGWPELAIDHGGACGILIKASDGLQSDGSTAEPTLGIGIGYRFI